MKSVWTWDDSVMDYSGDAVEDGAGDIWFVSFRFLLVSELTPSLHRALEVLEVESLERGEMLVDARDELGEGFVLFVLLSLAECQCGADNR